MMTMTPSVYKFNVGSSLSDAIDYMTAGKVSHIKDSNPKVRELHDRLVAGGYNPFEFLVYFIDEWIGIGGLNQLRIINRWTSDAVWIGFIEDKQRKRNCVKHHYTIECSEVSLRLDNNLSTRVEILTTNICSFRMTGPVVKLDMAMAWIIEDADPEIEAWINKWWNIALMYIRSAPELLPYVNTLRNYLLQERNIYEVITL